MHSGENETVLSSMISSSEGSYSLFSLIGASSRFEHHPIRPFVHMLPSMPKRIAILLHHRDIRDLTGHRQLVWYMADVWEEMGLETEVFRGIPSSPAPFDLLLPHIDLTKVPTNYVRFMEKFPRVLNRQLTDISKRKISQNLLDRDTRYDGPVIVKTDANSGGMPERHNRGVSRRIGDRMLQMISPGTVRHMHPARYAVFEEKSLVPDTVWRNRNLVVERFIPEREGEYYCNRICFFFGNVVLGSRIYSKSKVIKADAIEHMETVDVPPEILRKREELGLDYGKFDYVVHKGEVHILDANKTPGAVESIAVNTSMAERLAPGIAAYL